MFEHLTGYDDHEEVRCFFDRDAGLTAVIAVHRYVDGLAGGGTRMFAYGSVDDATSDALKLSRAMSYKYALAGIRCGGGKAAIIADPASQKDGALLRAFGRAVDTFGGRYFAGPDVGVSGRDVKVIGEATAHVRGLPDRTGDSSLATALGVQHALRAALRVRLNTDRLKGLRLAIQGVGGVGGHLARRAAWEGARLVIADVDPEKVHAIAAETGAEIASVDDILTSDVDIIAPCAMGGVISTSVASRLQAQIVCGGANNQLTDDEAGARLAQRGILFVPDFVANAGGVIVGMQDAVAFEDGTQFVRLVHIEHTCAEIFERCAASGQRPELLAVDLAKARLSAQQDRPAH